MSREFRPGETLDWHFTTRDPSTGAPAEPAKIPEGILYREGVQVGTPVVSIIRTGFARFKATVPFPSSWSGGDQWQLCGSASVNGYGDTGDLCDGVLIGYPRTAIPNAAAGAVGGLPVLDSSGNISAAATFGTAAVHSFFNAPGMVDDLTMGQFFRLAKAVLAGESDVNGQNTEIVFRREDGSVAVTVAFDAFGNRTNVTIGDLD